MSPLPDFTITSTFPIFTSCPVFTNPSDLDHEDGQETQDQYLLGTIGENMTLSTSPTFILKDRVNVSFALTIKLPPPLVDEQKYMGKFDASSFKKGFTAVVRNPKRKGVKEGKVGFVECGVEDVSVIPTSVEKLLIMSQYERSLRAQGEVDSSRVCAACGKNAREGQILARCKGCQGVWYCNKTCQVQGWNENGHKTECKVLKAAGMIFPLQQSLAGLE